jgi:hypothetical protein
LNVPFSMGGDKRTLALAANDEVFGGELINGFTYRALADFVPAGKLLLTGNGSAGFPFATLQALQYEGLDLLIERTECPMPRIARPGRPMRL